LTAYPIYFLPQTVAHATTVVITQLIAVVYVVLHSAVLGAVLRARMQILLSNDKLK
jgi:hypothetical protein